MKYIRTKDGIYDLEKYCITNASKKVLHSIITGVDDNKDIEIINQANTIEELCDEFVVEDRDEFAIFHNLKLAKQTKGIIYGAIWTDKGLIYVAKMNEKGVLELL